MTIGKNILKAKSTSKYLHWPHTNRKSRNTSNITPATQIKPISLITIC